MGKFEQIDESNFIEYCSEVCDKRHVADLSDLHEILRYVGYVKRLFTEYDSTGELKERLILNHIIILNNIFGPEHTPRILFFKTDKKHFSYLKTFLTFLNIMPLEISGLDGPPIFDSDIPINILVNSKLFDI